MNSTAKNVSGQAKRFTPKPKEKEAPAAALHVLALDGSNVTVWKDALHAYAEANYYAVGRAFANGERLAREKPSLAALHAEFPELGEVGLQNMLQQAIAMLIKDQRRDTDHEGSLFALIGQVTTDEGLARVKNRDGYEAIATARNAVALLKLVESEHTLMMHHASKREMKYVAQYRYFKVKQTSGQTDEDYTNKFKLARANMVEVDCEFKPSPGDDALHYLMNMDPARHGEFMRDAINRERADEGRGIPATVQGVIEAARRFIVTPKASQSSASLVYTASATAAATTAASAKATAKTGRQKPCGNCKVVGHYAKDCTAPCDTCGKVGHVAHVCPERVDTKSTRVMVAESGGGADAADSEDEDDAALFGYNYSARVARVFHSVVKDNKWLFTIDSYANESFVYCEDLLADCCDDETVVHGIHGPAAVGRRGQLPGLGPAIVAPAGGVNGLALCQLEDRYKVTYVQGVAIVVDVSEECQLVFSRVAHTGCYSCLLNPAVMFKLRETGARSKYIMVNTVAEREADYSKREVARAAKAREMLRKLYHPSDASLVRTINSGVMTNCDVTGKDVVIATDVWGKDVASIRGKSKDHGPADDRRMFVPVMERKEQVVYCDVFHWRQVSFLLFVVKPLKLLMVQWLPKATIRQTAAAVTNLANKLAARGYRVTEIVVDPGKQLTGLDGKVQYKITTVDARTHVPDAEVEIRTIKERMRCTESRLPYKLPRRAVRYLADGVVGAYNTTLRAGETVSPRELFTGIKFDYARDLKFEYGEYVEAIVIPGPLEKNGNKQRSVPAIALCSTGNDKGGWWFMSIKTKTFFNALRGVRLPMPDIVIERLNKIAELDEGVKESVLETEVVPVEEAHEDVTNLVGMPTHRDAVEPINETELGAITENNVNTEQLLSAHDELELNTEDVHMGGIESMIISTSENVDQDQIMPDQDTIARDDTASNNVQPDGRRETTDISANGQAERRSERIAARRSLQMTSGDHELERTVHMYRVRTVRALGPLMELAAKRTVRILRLTIKKAMEKNPEATIASVRKEFQQLVDRGVWTVMRKANLTGGQLRAAIRSSMFLKEKFDAAGVFDKLKARLVAGGDGQDKSLYGDLSCPTVTQETVMTVLAIAAAERRKVMTVDITGAYLECDMTGDVEVIMKLDPVLSKILQDVDKTAIGRQDEKGVTYVKLNKALYGTVQAALLWYRKLRGVLEADSYVSNPYDACLFNKTVDGVQITICFHVDDLLVTTVSEKLRLGLVHCLKSNFQSITVNAGKCHSYLAMNIEENEDDYTVDMTAYIDKCVGDKKFTRPASSPAKDDLFDEPEDSKTLGADAKANFHSSVAQLLYLCKRTRVESLCAVNHLSSRVSKSTEDDEIKLNRVLNYLSHTKNRKIVMKKGGAVEMEAFIDASFGAHADGRSRTGIALMLCGVCVGAWSTKQKLNTKSSTEAEIVGLSDGLSHVIWLRELLLAQGYALPPTRVHQDNQGVLSIMEQGRRPKHRTKHLNIRHFFAKDRVESGDIVLTYCPTREMVADVLTKAVNGELFQYLCGLLWPESL